MQSKMVTLSLDATVDGHRYTPENGDALEDFAAIQASYHEGDTVGRAEAELYATQRAEAYTVELQARFPNCTVVVKVS